VSASSRVPRVLVLDADPDVRDALVRVLREGGFDAEGFPDGALEGVDLSRVDLVITDLYIPGQGGIGVLARLQKEARHVRTIALTGDPGFCGEDMLDRARLMHADVRLAKPVANEDVLRACRDLLAATAA
jgi:CheY-like chemotaxis protein